MNTKISPELNADDINVSITKLESLDYKTASIFEIEELLTPLFKGLTVVAPSYEAGVHLYRSRKVNGGKPKYLRELSYPDKKYINDYGRANDIGKSMFYGSISKNIPFFELHVEVGDKIVMSIWKTKSNLLVKHVGFTDEVKKSLRSGRDLDSIYSFVSETNSFSDLNKYVYNYLAAKFSKNVPKDKTYLYKLTIATVNKLTMGNILQGVIYPTMAMSGNSDNIVLKPEYVDSNLEFVAVEYLEIIKKDDEFGFNVLDSAVEINNGEIIWSGKHLGWKIDTEGKSFTSDGSDWITKDMSGERINPILANLILKNTTPLEEKFHAFLPSTFKFSEPVTLNNPKESSPLLVCH